jgi:lipoprotein-releasing system ATP-binding protein
LIAAGPRIAVLELRQISKLYQQVGSTLRIVENASLTVWPGEIVGLVGPSGAGKSTLLHIAGLLDRPTTGQVCIQGRDITGLGDAERTRLRRDLLGFVYQYHHLLPEFSALENVMLPQLIAAAPIAAARRRAHALLDALGLSQREKHRPAKLSGGEQQRVAVARAMANKPALILADEPTGNLDPATAERVFGLLRGLIEAARIGALVATHNLELAGRMSRVLRIQDGTVVEHRFAAGERREHDRNIRTPASP